MRYWRFIYCNTFKCRTNDHFQISRPSHSHPSQPIPFSFPCSFPQKVYQIISVSHSEATAACRKLLIHHWLVNLMIGNLPRFDLFSFFDTIVVLCVPSQLFCNEVLGCFPWQPFNRADTHQVYFTAESPFRYRTKYVLHGGEQTQRAEQCKGLITLNDCNIAN